MTLQRALLLLIASVLLAGILPAGIALDRLLGRELEATARDDLRRAARLLADRDAAIADAMMMHAKELAHAPGLVHAVQAGDRARAVDLATDAATGFRGETAVVVSQDGDTWMGPASPPALVETTRRGEMPVAIVDDSARLHTLALAPLEADGRWMGAAGVARPLDDAAAATLAALTRSDIAIVTRTGAVSGSSMTDSSLAVRIAATSERITDNEPLEVRLEGRRYVVARAALGDAGAVLFARDMGTELAALPKLRRVAAISSTLALAVGLLLGAVFAARLARPVRTLATAADRLTAGDFGAPIEASPIREIDRVASAFSAMRRALATRLDEIERANVALADRNLRLTALQSELMQRERLAATGRLVSQLAHEIRNPVANLRNLLELINRRLDRDSEARRYASLAIGELLRMHELAEQLLDVHRPRASGAHVADPLAIAREVAMLAGGGDSGSDEHIDAAGDADARAAIAPDALKQVLLNLVNNAREAITAHGSPGDQGRIVVGVERGAERVRIVVRDDGPGIPSALLPRVFDPFFTTKGSVHGVGLGLFVAEGLVRTAGGRITAEPDPELGGARFIIELPSAPAPVAAEALR